ncbi:MAG TPA: hypothetical protein ENG35_00015 [Desulfobacteraceae bacterium]|nr:hypothetical protein [Desulfobacteraceae bacterium]
MNRITGLIFTNLSGHMRLIYRLRQKKMIIYALLIVISFLASGCAFVGKNNIESKHHTVEPDFYSVLQTDCIECEITRLKNVIKTGSDPSLVGKSFLHLAFLYSSNKNVNPNYRLALEMLKKYDELKPEHKKKCFVSYLKSLLQQISENKNLSDTLNGQITALKKEYSKSESKNRLLKMKCKKLSKENHEMQEVIEKLKYLDIRLEEKRRKVE